MQIHNVQQGSPEWLALRRQYFTASEAPAMMGVSPYMTRTELLRQKATGLVPEVDAHQQARFDAGHAAEAAFRPIAEEIVGEDLYPVTGTLHTHGLPLLSSYDGLTMGEDQGFEHKFLNQDIVAHINAHAEPGPAYYWQLEQQLLVSGAERILFATSNGTKDGAVAIWYESKPERRAALIAGWQQFAADLAQWKPTEVVAQAVAAPIESLPAVSVQMQGSLVVASNLPDFGVALRSFINRMVPKPSTDQEFADADAECKALKNAEDALARAEEQSLASLSDVAEARRIMADLKNLARTTRLAREKLVAAEKDNRRTAIYQGGVKRFQDHIAALNARLGRPLMPVIAGVDFAGAIKGKRSLDSMQDAVDTHLSTLKINANEIADKIAINLAWLHEHAADHMALFADAAQLVLKDADAFAAIAQARIAQHEAEIKRKAEAAAERERAAIAEQERVKAEAKVRAEQSAQQAAQPAAAPVVQRALDHAVAVVTSQERPTVALAAAAAPPAADATPQGRDNWTKARPVPSMPLGKIAERLGFTVTADFLRTLGFEPAARVKAAVLYHEDDFPSICRALIEHIESVMEGVAA